jgi:hypothetical protein
VVSSLRDSTTGYKLAYPAGAGRPYGAAVFCDVFLRGEFCGFGAVFGGMVSAFVSMLLVFPDALSGGVVAALLNHRLQAGTPKGCLFWG